MSTGPRTFGILTCGGDCPALNAVIRGAAKTLLNRGCRVYGIMNGFNGLINENVVELHHQDLVNIVTRGGTILGTSNRDNPFKFARHVGDQIVFEDRHEAIIKNIKKYGMEALILLGGDGSMNIGYELASVSDDVKVVACPKTIDNDLSMTERTFGFDTAVSVATEALDRLLTTAESHHRVMILEVMGRYAGWIAIHTGIAGSANVILIPEIPYNFDKIVEKIKERQALGKRHSLIVVAEGAKPVNGELTVARIVKDSFEPIRLGGIGQKLANQLEEATGLECRCTTLGYVQRGGTPTSYDRVLSLRYGVAAAFACLNKEYNVMMSLQGDKIVHVPISEVVKQNKHVPVDGELVQVAKALGIGMGD